MLSYIGIKQVKAKPMTRQDYNTLRGWEVPLDENPLDEGYLVEYADSEPNHKDFSGYISWSPKETFEKYYKENGTPINRMQIELDDLHDRLDKLGSFLEKGKPNFLDENEWELLFEQQKHMTEYYNTLNTRLMIAKSKE